MKVKLSEYQYNVFKKYLKENQESDSQKKAIKYLEKNANMPKESCERYIRVTLRTIIPILNGNSKSGKFTLGAIRLLVEEATNKDDNNLINLCIETITNNEELYNKYDKNLNGLNIEELYEQVKGFVVKRRKSRKKSVVNSSYKIVKINSFKESNRYSDYTFWCITHSEGAYNNYTKNGACQFYFCLKDGFEDVEPNYKDTVLDEYGLSMIAVCVEPDGKLKTCTCRYNHDHQGNDHILSEKQIEKITGYNFDTTFLPNEEYYKKQKALDKEVKKITSLEDLSNLCRKLNSESTSSVYVIKNNNPYLVRFADDSVEGDVYLYAKIGNDKLKYFKTVDFSEYDYKVLGKLLIITNTDSATRILYNLDTLEKINKYGQIKYINEFKTDSVKLIMLNKSIFLDYDCNEVDFINNYSPKGYEIYNTSLVGYEIYECDYRILEVDYINEEDGDIKSIYVNNGGIIASNVTVERVMRNVVVFTGADNYKKGYNCDTKKTFELVDYSYDNYNIVFENYKADKEEFDIYVYILNKNNGKDGSYLKFTPLNDFIGEQVNGFVSLDCLEYEGFGRYNCYLINDVSNGIIIYTSRNGYDLENEIFKGCKIDSLNYKEFTFHDGEGRKNHFIVKHIGMFGDMKLNKNVNLGDVEVIENLMKF